jgi:hypothetical protein
MVRNILLSSIAVVGVSSLPVSSFSPDTSNLHNVRLAHLVEVVSSPASDAPYLQRVTTATEEQIDNNEGHVADIRDLPPVLQQITDERRNFQRNLGKAMDTLRKDMPYILKRQPGTNLPSHLSGTRRFWFNLFDFDRPFSH